VAERSPTREELDQLREAGWLPFESWDGPQCVRGGQCVPWHEALRIEHEVVDLDEEERRG
jgi:hypothetical protein